MKENYSDQAQESIIPAPDSVSSIRLSPETGTLLKMETYITCYGFKGVVGHWGREYLKEETDAMTRQFYGEDKVIDAGFSSLWRVPPGTSMERAIEDELEVDSIMIRTALELHG